MQDKFQEFLEKNLTIAQMVECIDDAKHFKKEGILGDAMLRKISEAYIQFVGARMSITLIMQFTAFECYSILWDRGVHINNWKRL